MRFSRCTTGVRCRRSTAASPTGRRSRLRSSAIAMSWSAATTAVPGEQIDVWSRCGARSARTGSSSLPSTSPRARLTRRWLLTGSDHWDLLEYLKRNWSTVGPELKDNIYFFAGDADTYFLNNSTMELDAWLKTATTAPHSQAQFMYGNLKPHCWQGPVTACAAGH